MPLLQCAAPKAKLTSGNLVNSLLLVMLVKRMLGSDLISNISILHGDAVGLDRLILCFFNLFKLLAFVLE